MSIQIRLNVVMGILLLVALAGVTFALLAEAAPRVRAENESIMRLTRDLVRSSLLSFKGSDATDIRVKGLVSRFDALRHVRVTWSPARAPSAQSPQSTSSARSRSWWHLVGYRDADSIIVPVQRDGKLIGQVVISAEPSDEMEEVSGALGYVATVGTVLALAIFAVTSWVIGWSLRPLRDLGNAITRMEDGNYDIAVLNRGAPEIRAISDKLQGLASALRKASSENSRLSQLLVTTQDDERREVARELHDELGPHLFAARARGTSLRDEISRKNPDKRRLHAYAHDMLGEIECIQAANRRVLQKLAPAGLRELGLTTSVEGLARSWRANHPEVAIRVTMWPDADDLDDATTLTVYRVVQEGLTNAFRHAQPSIIDVSVDLQVAVDTSAHDQLVVEIKDDGKGPTSDIEFGFGLTGMRERIVALGGTLTLSNVRPGGASLRVELPARGKS